ncbi:MAG TPA: hypothetical protein VGP51_09860 [Nocardioidaceae bacterium]|jgi:hypothetical protein|nr:hypothetical protein [Actinomycetota bacterium]HEV8056778.1 hypothetical protein [Nocardioidaceae bacterium]
MEFVHKVLLFVHLLGMAALVGGAFVQLRADSRMVNNAMLHGAFTQVLSGVLLVGVLEGDDSADVDHVKIGVKFGLAVVIALLLWANRTKPAIPDGLYFGLFGLAVVTVGVAVFW